MRERDIVDLLQDFDGYGNSATERFLMRIRAAEEIKQLRADREPHDREQEASRHHGQR